MYSTGFRFGLMAWALCAVFLVLESCNPTDGDNHNISKVDLIEEAFDWQKALKLPPNFKISIFADNVPNARSLARGDNGTIFVGNRAQDRVYALVDTNADGVSDKKYTIAQGLNTPNGVAFHKGSLYVGEINRILRYDDIENRLTNPPQPVVVYDKLPKERHHGWKYLKFSPDGWLYVPVGAPCDNCLRTDDKRFASILRMKPDGSEAEIFAEGVRNTVGFDFHPESKELWFTDNGRDWLGDKAPNDELNHAPTKGAHFGYPFCHGGEVKDPEFGDKRPCSDFKAPAQKLIPHAAALGMAFYTGKQFPEEYRGNIFIAEHGSWNSTNKVGYRVTRVKLEGRKAVKYEPFIEGWLKNGKVGGRPVDVLNLPDGSVLISDDKADRIYRVVYQP